MSSRRNKRAREKERVKENSELSIIDILFRIVVAIFILFIIIYMINSEFREAVNTDVKNLYYKATNQEYLIEQKEDKSKKLKDNEIIEDEKQKLNSENNNTETDGLEQQDNDLTESNNNIDDHKIITGFNEDEIEQENNINNVKADEALQLVEKEYNPDGIYNTKVEFSLTPNVFIIALINPETTVTMELYKVDINTQTVEIYDG